MNEILMTIGILLSYKCNESILSIKSDQRTKFYFVM